ncbi:FecR family protein [Emticicia fontis]
MQQDTEMDILIAKFFSGEATPEEAMQLEDWADVSPENRNYLNTSANFFTMNLALNIVENKQQVWENVRKAIDKPVAPSGLLMNWRGINVAASVMLLLAVGLLFYTFSNQQAGDTIYEASTVAKTVSLADRSEITISPNSSITVDKNYGVDSRKIHLNGSAQFSVIHDATKPFVVDVNNVHIKDLGTTFIVKTSPGYQLIFIEVTEGEVEISDDFGYSKVLKAGEAGTYDQSRKRLYPVNFEPAKESLKPDIEGNKTPINLPDTTRKKKTTVSVSTSVSSDKNGSTHSYSSSYSADNGYTPEGQQELVDKADKTTKRILADMRKEGLIGDSKKVSFTISDKGFFINGEKQSEEVFRRYEKKYNPVINTNGVWSWSYAND